MMTCCDRARALRPRSHHHDPDDQACWTYTVRSWTSSPPASGPCLRQRTPASRDAREIAERLRTGLRKPFTVDGIDLDVDASIGLALVRSATDRHLARPPVDPAGITIDDLLRQADVAMYAAKRGTISIVVYAPHHDINTRARLVLLSELRRAVADDQLVLHFQPKLELGTRAVTGAEALVRWQHPLHGLLLPAEFIPAAEATQVIVALTDRVLELALREARVLRDVGLPLQIAVNVAPRCLLDPDLPARVDELLHRHDLPATALRLEITETVLIEDPETALIQLNALDRLGVGLSIDDFGTGYSSLTYLRRLPVDEIKVDQTFRIGMLDCADDAVIVRAAIDLGHNLGVTVVAEGVEDEATLLALAACGCDIAQGYGIARPMPGDRLLTWLRDRARAVAIA